MNSCQILELHGHLLEPKRAPAIEHMLKAYQTNPRPNAYAALLEMYGDRLPQESVDLHKSWYGPAKGGTHVKRATNQDGKDGGGGKSKTAAEVESLRNSPVLHAASLPVHGVPYSEALAIGKQYYAGLLRTTVTAPAFKNRRVVFTPKGWMYLTSDAFAKQQQHGHNKNRTEDDVRRRIALLPKALAVIQHVKNHEPVRNEGDGVFRYGLLGRFADGDVVRVVVEEVKKGGHSFLSVFDLDRVAKQLGRPSLPGRPASDAPSGQGKATDASSSGSTIPNPGNKATKSFDEQFDLLKSHLDACFAS